MHLTTSKASPTHIKAKITKFVALALYHRPARFCSTGRGYQMRFEYHNVMRRYPVAPPGATMAISFHSDEEVLRKLRDKLRKMTDEGIDSIREGSAQPGGKSVSAATRRS